jgi:hypothetical protein
MSKIHKCPFCLYSFERSEAIPFNYAGGDITTYRCPNPREKLNGQKFCDKELPLNFFDADSTVISIVGSRNVGKTHYLIALLLQLRMNKSLHKIGISGMLIGHEDSINDINRKIDDITSGKKINFSLMNTGVEEMALVIDLTIKKGKTSKHIYLSFFDTPGEGYANRRYMYENFQCLYKADGLLFLIEPLQISYLIDDIHENNNYLTDQSPHDLQEVFYNVIDLLKYVQRNKKTLERPAPKPKPAEPNPQENPTEPNPTDTNTPPENPKIDEEKPEEPEVEEGQSTQQTFWQKLFGQANVPTLLHPKVKCPIAIGVTKVDQIKHRMLQEIPFDNTDFETMYLKGNQINRELIKDISSELKDLVFHEEEGEIGVKNMLDSEIESYEFFGIKSGDVDLKTGKIDRMNAPQGILLPLIWLLIKLKLY